MEGKLKELNIPFMYVGDYLEESPLGKAEWLVALAEVTGKRTEGEKVFADIPVRYNALKKRVTDAAIDAPSVMLNTPYGDNWFMPSTESYVARLIKDAGGDYIYKKNTGNASAPIDLEEAYLLARKSICGCMWVWRTRSTNCEPPARSSPTPGASATDTSITTTPARMPPAATTTTSRPW